MSGVRLGAVEYLNARPLVCGLDRAPRFDLRYDLPSECARLLHARGIDVGLIPSIEYLRGGAYRIVPDLAIASRGPVASVALYITREISEVRSVAMDTSSRTSVALVRVLCARLFKIDPLIESLDPDLNTMLNRCDAALVIGDNALLWDPGHVRLKADATSERRVAVEKIDLGEKWTELTGLPFVWAFWAGQPDALGVEDVRVLREARDAGVRQSDAIAREYFRNAPELQPIAARYLRDNIKYYLGAEELTGLQTFFRYAAEAGVIPQANELLFY